MSAHATNAHTVARSIGHDIDRALARLSSIEAAFPSAGRLRFLRLEIEHARLTEQVAAWMEEQDRVELEMKERMG